MHSLPWWFWVALPVAVVAGWALIVRMLEDWGGLSSREYLEHADERAEQNRLWEEKGPPELFLQNPDKDGRLALDGGRRSPRSSGCWLCGFLNRHGYTHRKIRLWGQWLAAQAMASSG
jgi:hypothetical protein